MVNAQDLPDWGAGGLTLLNLAQTAKSYTLAAGATANLIPATVGKTLLLFDGFIHSGETVNEQLPLATTYSLAASATDVLIAGVAGTSIILGLMQLVTPGYQYAPTVAGFASTLANGASHTMVAGVANQFIIVLDVSVAVLANAAATTMVLADTNNNVLASFIAGTVTDTPVVAIKNNVLGTGLGLKLVNNGPNNNSATLSVYVTYVQLPTSVLTELISLQDTAGNAVFQYDSGLAQTINKDFAGYVIPAGRGLQVVNTVAQAMQQTDKLNLQYQLSTNPSLTETIQIERTDGTELLVYTSGKGIAVPLSFRGLTLPAGQGLQAHNTSSNAMSVADLFNLNYLSN